MLLDYNDIKIRLNHCVGGRNYVAFLMCVVSAVVAGMVILAAVVAELVFYYTNSEWLVLWSSTVNRSNDSNSMVESMPSQAFNDTFAMNLTTIATSLTNATETFLDENVMVPESAKGINVHDTIFLIFIAVLGILAAISVGLLLHLCFFHVYISFLGLTTYEYIRNQRQQNNIPTTNPNGAGTSIAQPATTLNALKKSSSATQLYFCSSIDPKNLVENHSSNTKYRPKSLHCCDNTLEYHKTTHKAFYMCSVLQERNANVTNGIGTSASSSPIANKNTCQSRTFHCCSEYKQVVRMPTPTVARIDINEHATRNHDDSTELNQYVQLSEQCTFCSFKMRAQRKDEEANGTTAANMALADESRQRCCTKTMTNHHRWKRKWNCCSNVPDSPDTPGDVLHTVSASMVDSHNHSHQQNGAKNLNYSLRNSIKPIQPAKTDNIRPSLSTNLKNGRSRLVRPWPIARFRHMLRMIGRCRHPTNCRHETANGNSQNAVSIKQNQVRPLSVPDLPKNVIKTQILLPTSAIRGGIGTIGAAAGGNATTNVSLRGDSNFGGGGGGSGVVTVPALPPPTRRKIRNTSEIDELAESLTFVQQPLRHSGPSNGRRRRKNLLRTRSPTLSPIHETGYSNPASPQPCRHGGTAPTNYKIKTIINNTSNNSSTA